jgi:hypothetical protein
MAKIPGLSFSLKRAVGISGLKTKVARAVGIPTTKQGLERKIGGTILKGISGKKNG